MALGDGLLTSQRPKRRRRFIPARSRTPTRTHARAHTHTHARTHARARAHSGQHVRRWQTGDAAVAVRIGYKRPHTGVMV